MSMPSPPNLTWDDVEDKWKALQLEAYGKDWSLRPALSG